MLCDNCRDGNLRPEKKWLSKGKHVMLLRCDNQCGQYHYFKNGIWFCKGHGLTHNYAHDIIGFRELLRRTFRLLGEDPKNLEVTEEVRKFRGN